MAHNTESVTLHVVLDCGTFTDTVTAKHSCADVWHVWYSNRWRKVHVQVKRTYIVCWGRRHTVDMRGLV